MQCLSSLVLIGSVLDCSEEVWDKIFDINVKASFLLAKQAAPLIRERGGGSIVFISSLAGFNPFKVRDKKCLFFN